MFYCPVISVGTSGLPAFSAVDGFVRFRLKVDFAVDAAVAADCFKGCLGVVGFEELIVF